MENSPAEDWNAYWEKKLENSSPLRLIRTGIAAHIITDNLPLLRARQVRRILLAGNGCSLLPYALVHLGFDVTVVDISTVANEAIASVKPTPKVLAVFLPEYRKEQQNGIGTVWVYDREASLQRVEPEATPGGSLTIVTADILEWEPPSPVDAIYDDRFAMLLAPTECTTLARAYYRWLNPFGICIFRTINLDATARIPLETAVDGAGFQEQHLRSMTVAPPSGKCVYFVHGSG